MKGNFVNFRRNRRAAMALALLAALSAFTIALAAGEMLDPYFGTNGIVTTNFNGIYDFSNRVILQPDGRIIVSGFDQDSTPFVARYNENGSVDTAFGVNGVLTPQISPFGNMRVAVQSDGKLIVAGTSNGRFVVSRYTANGASLDTSFGANGVMYYPDDGSDFAVFHFSDVVIQPDQKIIAVGTEIIGNYYNYVILRLTASGDLDETFVTNGVRILDDDDFPNARYNSARAVALQGNGKIVMSGDMMNDSDGDQEITLARLNPDGSMDTANFGSNGKGTVSFLLDGFVHSSGALLIQPDERIVVGGYIDYYATPNSEDLALARINANGTLDTAFGGDGIVTTDLGFRERTSDIVLQPDGKIVLVGKMYSPDFADILLVRYNSNGSLDDTFGENGVLRVDFNNASDSGNGIALQPNGMIVLAATRDGNVLLARYITDVSDHPLVSATFTSKSGPDGWILESTETSSRGGSLNKTETTLLVGDDAKDREYRGILSFNTIGIPDDAILTSAEVRIKRQGIVGTDPFATHGDLLLEIRTGAFSGSLALQLSDFRAAGSAGAVQERLTAQTYPWYTAVLGSTNLKYVNKYGVTQFRLRFTLGDNDDMSADHLKLFTGEAAASNRPVLLVTYFVP
ncbi:MAG: hypothetical protein DPW18_19055 [Chloroflexi bacterium]|nr:hypothetical protein [Chloroflexota bacterium]MDL1940753.1 hypothetical protein [Chloroflexi bacterium CFX2]